MKSTTTCHAHDEHNIAKQGQKVCIEQCRPLSKTKRWMFKYLVEDEQEGNHDLHAN
jgi:small subunit ribosomal protein S17